jgi:UDP-2-acetamido-2,6-beta-L-arabino-hexul-4-ose reductase
MSTNPTGLVAVEILPRAADHRGWLCEPLAAAEFAGQRNVHLVFTRPGGVRGNHFHRRTTEIMTVAGPALVRLRVESQDRDFVIPANEAHRFTVPPGVPHAILNTGSEPGVVLSFTDQVHDPANPDTVREVLIEPLNDA